MAKDAQGGPVVRSDAQVQASKDARAKARHETAERVKKLDARNKWAYGQATKAQTALDQLKEHILSGKPPTAQAVSACAELSRLVADTIFAE